jgi:multidrug resistance efflux pump
MRRLSCLGMLLLAVAASRSSVADEAPSSSLATSLNHCLITAIDDVQVPSPRPGMLTEIQVREGARIAKSAVLAQLDDTDARIKLRSAQAERDAAAARAKSELDVRYAQATHAVAETEHRISVQVNERQPNSVSLIEVERLRLTAEQAALKIELGKHERDVRLIESGVALAKAESAENDVRLHRIVAPLDGEVTEIYGQAGEWVEAGKPVMRVVRLDRLRVEGFVHVRDWLPSELVGRQVTVRVKLARNGNSPARSPTSARSCRPAAITASGPKSTIAANKINGCCVRASKPK